jgi:hypothetical protein
VAGQVILRTLRLVIQTATARGIEHVKHPLVSGWQLQVMTPPCSKLKGGGGLVLSSIRLPPHT